MTAYFGMKQVEEYPVIFCCVLFTIFVAGFSPVDIATMILLIYIITRHCQLLVVTALLEHMSIVKN